MQNLLTEDEFASDKKYNPWPKFGIFYLIAFAQVITVQMVSALSVNAALIIGGINIIVTVALCLTLFLHKKEMLALPWNKKITGMLVLVAVYVVTTLLSIIINYGLVFTRYSLNQALSQAAAHIVIFTVCSIAIYIVQKSKQRNGKL
jgi:hypothetical protein